MNHFSTVAGSTPIAADVLSDRVEVRRRRSAAQQIAPVKSELGQFMTPAIIAKFMASMFSPANSEVVRLLDPGAGIGSLTAAFVERLCLAANRPSQIEIVACEVDPTLRNALQVTLRDCVRVAAAHEMVATCELLPVDFIEHFTAQAAGGLFGQGAAFTHIITNPPYRKIGSQSTHRKLLRSAGIETSNLYSGFVALAIQLLAAGGELVAITPRSFCNGPYFLPFRRLLLNTMAIRQVHTFGARDVAFKDDQVLQENVIMFATRTPQPDEVLLSSSHGLDLANSRQRWTPTREVFQSSDPNLFIHIPLTQTDASIVSKIRSLRDTLESLGIAVSTGPVVEFRHAKRIHQEPGISTVPLIYPAHFNAGHVQWPKSNGRKPNAIEVSEETLRWLMPQGHYTVTRRFSAKEERRRIVAAVYDPTNVAADWVGFENHLNVFHCKGAGLAPTLARGLAIYLNSTIVDQYFRLFNGHTQVNATDLKVLPYPSLEALQALGTEASAKQLPDQAETDGLVEAIVFSHLHPSHEDAPQ